MNRSGSAEADADSPGVLDAAWAAAEAALPNGAWIVASGNERLGYNVLAYQMSGQNEIGTVFAKAPAGPLVPALRALAAALSAGSASPTTPAPEASREEGGA